METIKEDYVSFETAKLLTEKGFEGFTLFSYSNRGSTMCCHWENEIDWLPKCTLQMAMKWLREVHNIHIVIKIIIRTHGNTEYYYELYSTKNKSLCVVCDIYKGESWDSSEQACEAAIKYCLENLI